MKEMISKFGLLIRISSLACTIIVLLSQVSSASEIQKLTSDGFVYKKICYSTDTKEIPVELNFKPKCIYADPRTMSKSDQLCTADELKADISSGYLMKSCIHLIREVSIENYVFAAPVCSQMRQLLQGTINRQLCTPYSMITQVSFQKNQNDFLAQEEAKLNLKIARYYQIPVEQVDQNRRQQYELDTAPVYSDF